MTATQIKRAFAALPEREKSSVAAWIRAERLSRDPAYASELTQRNQRMDEGRKWPLAEARKLSRALARRGL
jgi:transposase